MDIGDPFGDPFPSPNSPSSAPIPPFSARSENTAETSTSETFPTKKSAKQRKATSGKENRSSDNNVPASPNVDELLASLEAQVAGPGSSQPPLPSTSAFPVPPPPPPPPQNPAGSAPKDLSTTSTGTEALPAGKRKRKPRATRQQKQQNAGSQRTEGKTSVPPSSSHTSTHPPVSAASSTGATPHASHNRTWTNPAVTTSSSASSLSSASAYSRRPNQAAKRDICKDITSHKFCPEDEERVEIVLKTILGENMGRECRMAPSTLVHTLPQVHSSEVTGIPADQAPGARTEWDEEQFLTVPDFTTRFPDQVSVTIARKPSVAFLILSRQIGTRKRWGFPNYEAAADFVNDALSTMFHGDIPFADTYDRSGRWGLVSTILLKTSDLGNLHDFRSYLANFSFHGMSFDTFPKEVATMKPDISILLRNNMKSFHHEVLPKVLFIRNKERLAGSLRVLATKMFPDGEKSHRGESKENWRQIELKGDDQVMRCLRFIPESSPFKLGVETVQIRGGLRPQDPEEQQLLGKRTWSSSTSSSNPPIAILAPQPGGTPNKPLTSKNNFKKAKGARGKKQ